ncbi:hypothetical protein HYV86_05875 [Candidatus Woesearchaeota archaeon]|nr:hypothetical protein [Candidatus Woesearchaeota archaeon]
MLSKLQRVLIALVIVLLYPFLKILIGDFSTTSLIRDFFLSLVGFVLFYNLLGNGYNQNVNQKKVKYPIWFLRSIPTLSYLYVITLIVGIILAYALGTKTLFWVALSLFFSQNFLVTLVHLSHVKKISKSILTLFTAIFIPLSLVALILPFGKIKIVLFGLLSTPVLIITLYGFYVKMKFVDPEELNYLLQKRLKQKKK